MADIRLQKVYLSFTCKVCGATQKAFSVEDLETIFCWRYFEGAAHKRSIMEELYSKQEILEPIPDIAICANRLNKGGKR